MRYQHTQDAKLIKWIMGVTILLYIFIAGLNGFSSLVTYSLCAMALIMVSLTWSFCSLTVEISGKELRHYFGPGFWKKTYLLQDIESVKQVRNSWIFGWWIRLTPHGWLYNVSGLDAVEIKLRSGRTCRIGTDDPKGILEELKDL